MTAFCTFTKSQASVTWNALRDTSDRSNGTLKRWDRMAAAANPRALRSLLGFFPVWHRTKVCSDRVSISLDTRLRSFGREPGKKAAFPLFCNPVCNPTNRGDEASMQLPSNHFLCKRAAQPSLPCSSKYASPPQYPKDAPAIRGAGRSPRRIETLQTPMHSTMQTHARPVRERPLRGPVYVASKVIPSDRCTPKQVQRGFVSRRATISSALSG